ncbi:MAG: ABC transporter permease, partial [Sediminibacterium sp.]
LSLAQDMFAAEGMITSYALTLNDNDDLTLTASSLSNTLGSEYEVMTWEQMMPDIKQHIGNDTQNMLVVQAVLYLLISFGIFGTLLMMMAERRFEIGMLVAIGMKKSKLTILFLIESLLTVFIGCTLGILTSIPVVAFFKINPITISGDAASAFERFGFEPIFPASTNVENFTSQATIVFIIGLVLSLYPVYVIWKLNPVQAMRK